MESRLRQFPTQFQLAAIRCGAKSILLLTNLTDLFQVVENRWWFHSSV